MNKWGCRLFVCGLLICSTVSFAKSTDDFLRSAQNYLDKNEVNAAVIQVKNGLKENPNSIPARALLGEIYLANGDPRSAEIELLRAIRLGGDQETLGLLLARAFLMQGKFDEVLNNIDLGKDISAKGRAELMVIKGNIFLIQGKTGPASDIYRKALELVDELPSALLGQARLYSLNKDFSHAINTLERVIELEKNNIDAWQLRGELQLQQGDDDEAQVSFTKALVIRPNNISSKLGMATVWIKRNDFTNARIQINSALKLAPFNPKANYLNGLVFLHEGDKNEAEIAFNQVQKIMPRHVPSIYLLGAIHYTEKEYQQAESLLLNTLDLAPDHLMGRKLLGATYLQLGQPYKTIDVLDEYRKYFTDDAQFYSLLGAAFMQTDNQEKGAELLEKAVEFSPDAALMRTQLAVGKLALGDAGNAIKELESALSLDSSFVQAELMLVYIHLKEKQFDAAISVANKMLESKSKTSIGYNILGLAYMGKGEKKLAQDSFEQALLEEDSFNSARINLAMLKLQDKDTQSAKKIYEDIIRRDSENIAAMVGIAKIAMQDGDIDQTVEWLVRAHNINMSRVDITAMLVDVYLKKGESLKAVQVARSTVNETPSVLLSHEVLGRAYMAAAEFSNATASYKRLLELSKGNVKAAMLLAGAQLKADNPLAAEKVIKKSIKEDNNNIQPYVFLAQLQLSQKEIDSALKTARMIQNKFKDEPVGHELEGDIYASTKQYNHAVEGYTRAFNISKTSSLVLKLYQSHSKQGNIADSVKLAGDWLKGQPEDVRVRMVLAMGYQGANEIKKANEHYIKIIDYQPNNVIALNNLAWGLAEKGDEQAIIYAKKAYELSKQSPAISDTYGWVLVQMGQYDKGINVLKEAIIKAPNLPDLRYHLAYAYYKNDNLLMAKKELKRLGRIGFSDKNKLEELKILLQ